MVPAIEALLDDFPALARRSQAEQLQVGIQHDAHQIFDKTEDGGEKTEDGGPRTEDGGRGKSDGFG